MTKYLDPWWPRQVNAKIGVLIVKEFYINHFEEKYIHSLSHYLLFGTQWTAAR